MLYPLLPVLLLVVITSAIICINIHLKRFEATLTPEELAAYREEDSGW